jgi:hypothetical protein
MNGHGETTRRPREAQPYLTVSFMTGCPLCRLLSLTELRWRYSNPPPKLVIYLCR